MKRLSIFLFSFSALCLATSATGQTCTPSPTTACLLDGRFQVEVSWTDVPGNPLTLPSWGLAGDGLVSLVPTETDPRTALFSFFTPDHPTMIVKLLDARAAFQRFWVFANAATNVAFTLTVSDTVSGQIETYSNPQGTIATPIFDTDSFFGLPSLATSAAAGPRPVDPLVAASHGVLPPCDDCPPPAPPSPLPCGPSKLCLYDERFEVTVTWFNRFTDTTGAGVHIPFSDSSGLYWFFIDRNVELVLDVLDGRSVNDHFWVHVITLTDLEWTMTIRDTRTGGVWTHTNPPGETSAVHDHEAFSDLSDVPTLSEWGLALLVVLLLGCGLLRLRRLRSHP